MGASLQWLTLVVRAGRSHEKYGDPYTVHVTLVNCGEYAQVSGLSGEMTREDWQTSLESISAFGITRLREYRKKSGWWEYDLSKKPFKRSRVK